MSSIWNFLSPLRTGHHYLAKSGNEMFGTVVKHGVNNKTVTVGEALYCRLGLARSTGTTNTKHI